MKVRDKMYKRNYQQELQQQMSEFKERQNKMWNEMSDREMAINMKPLMAYENMDRDIGNKMVPGFNQEIAKQSHGRYQKKFDQTQLND